MVTAAMRMRILGTCPFSDLIKRKLPSRIIEVLDNGGSTVVSFVQNSRAIVVDYRYLAKISYVPKAVFKMVLSATIVVHLSYLIVQLLRS